jgi:coenzyme F420-0:L-glutamate ligase/coenzyme F420-1:gamma-L-glutamate ligase
VSLGAPDDYDLGRLVVRAEVAAASEGLRVTSTTRTPGVMALELSG